MSVAYIVHKSRTRIGEEMCLELEVKRGMGERWRKKVMGEMEWRKVCADTRSDTGRGWQRET